MTTNRLLEWVHFVIFDIILIASLLLALLQYLLCLASGISVSLRVDIWEFKQSARKRGGVDEVLERSQNIAERLHPHLIFESSSHSGFEG